MAIKSAATEQPDGTILMPDGSAIKPSGETVEAKSDAKSDNEADAKTATRKGK